MAGFIITVKRLDDLKVKVSFQIGQDLNRTADVGSLECTMKQFYALRSLLDAARVQSTHEVIIPTIDEVLFNGSTKE